jgi:hypothetical protein
MNLLTLEERAIKRTTLNRSKGQLSFRAIARKYFATEAILEFAIEAFLFAIIVAVSAWPMIAAANALRDFLRLAPT